MGEPAKPELICEHFEIPDPICCEYCNAYPACPLHDDILILVRQVQRNWEDVELTDDDDDENWLEEYDYTEGDIGQDGEI